MNIVVLVYTLIVINDKWRCPRPPRNGLENRSQSGALASQHLVASSTWSLLDSDTAMSMVNAPSNEWDESDSFVSLRRLQNPLLRLQSDVLCQQARGTALRS